MMSATGGPPGRIQLAPLRSGSRSTTGVSAGGVGSGGGRLYSVMQMSAMRDAGLGGTRGRDAAVDVSDKATDRVSASGVKKNPMSIGSIISDDGEGLG